MIKDITVGNQTVLDIYSKTETLDLSGGQSLRSRGFDPEIYDLACQSSTSDWYLENKLDNQDTGFKIEHSSNILIGETAGGQYFLDSLRDLLMFDHYYTSGYVPHGFVGWHSDGDIGGWYLMITYSPKGNGFFKYRDIDSGKIVTLPDSTGWMTRTVELPTDPDRMFWHCAAAPSNRYTFLLLFNDLDKFNRAASIVQGDQHG